MGIILNVLRNQILLNAPHLAKTTPAAVASFSTDMKAPLKQCKVEFTPIQNGSGDPSPSNVRPIIGCTNFDVCLSTNYMIFEPITELPMTNNGVTLSYLNNGRYRIDGINNTTSNIHFIVNINTLTFSNAVGHTLYYNSNKTFGEQDVQIRLRYTNDSNYLNTLLDYDDSIKNYYFSISPGTSYLVNIGEIRFTVRPGQGDYECKPILVDTNKRDMHYVDLNGTYYGGYVDLVTGELVEEWVKAPIVGKYGDASNWSKFGSAADSLMYTTGIMGAGGYGFRKALTPILSDTLYLNTKGNPSNLAPNTIGYYLNDSRWPQYLFMANQDGLSLTDWRTWLCETYPDAQVCFQSETPITYQLTPVQLKSIVGSNNIWSNVNGDTTVTYWTH